MQHPGLTLLIGKGHIAYYLGGMVEIMPSGRGFFIELDMCFHRVFGVQPQDGRFLLVGRLHTGQKHRDRQEMCCERRL